MVNTNLYNTIFNVKQAGGSITNGLSTLLYTKRDLLVKTFANLIFQLGITYYVMEKTSSSKDKDITEQFAEEFDFELPHSIPYHGTLLQGDESLSKSHSLPLIRQ